MLMEWCVSWSKLIGQGLTSYNMHHNIAFANKVINMHGEVTSKKNAYGDINFLDSSYTFGFVVQVN